MGHSKSMTSIRNISVKYTSNWTRKDSFEKFRIWGVQNCPWLSNLIYFWRRYYRSKILSVPFLIAQTLLQCWIKPNLKTALSYCWNMNNSKTHFEIFSEMLWFCLNFQMQEPECCNSGYVTSDMCNCCYQCAGGEGEVCELSLSDCQSLTWEQMIGQPISYFTVCWLIRE